MTGRWVTGANRTFGAFQRIRRRFGSLSTIAAAAGLIALTWIGVREAERGHEIEARAHVYAEVANAALTMEEQFRAHLLAIEQTMRTLESEWEKAPAPFDLTAWRLHIPELTDDALQILIVDSSGLVLNSTRPQLVGRNVSSREYFRELTARSKDDGRMFAGSLSHGSITRSGQINLARRLNSPDGSFGGAIVIFFDLSSEYRVYRALDLGRNSVVALIGVDNGSVVALIGDELRGVRGSIAGSPLMSELAQTQSNLWTGASPLDGLNRVHAFRRISGRDLAVMVATEDRAVSYRSAEWERDATLFASGITLLLIILAGVLVRTQSAARRREEALSRERGALARKTGQLEATLAGMSDGVMMIDSQLRLLAWNDRFPAFTGVPRDILRVGLPMREMLRAQAEAGEFGVVDISAEVDRRMEMLEAGTAVGVVERVRPSGQIIELRRNRLPGGGFVTLYSDVTARRSAEERLREAQKMAAIGRLTAGVAHDFNNLLASIMGSAELMERHLKGDLTQARRLQIIFHGAQRGADLVQQLLAFSRKQPLAPITIDLNNIVRGMGELLRSTLGGAVRVDTRLCARWAAVADPVQVEHVILNLAINARDAMPQGGTITISTADVNVDTQAELSPGEYVAVAVSDTGTGMSPEVKRNALEPFFTTKPPGRGSGLGLSQVYGVANQSGGGVRIDSELGRGTTVTVFLPRSTNVRADQVEAARGRAETPVPGQGSVLLVEDEEDVRETICAMLEAIGYDVLAAGSGLAALQMLDRGVRFDLLLADFMMPGMSGTELADLVRREIPGIPVVLMTGYNDDPRIAGERWVLRKPFVAARLGEFLRAALRQASTGSTTIRETDKVAAHSE